MEKDCNSRTLKTPTVEATHLLNAMVESMADDRIDPQDVLFVLGEAVIRFLIASAEILDCEPKEMVKVFAEGLANAEIGYNED